MWRTLELTHATVREYNRFIESLPEMALLSGDLKNFQRPWVADALLRHLPSRGRVLEIGGDRCELADFLSRQGFEVWVIDAYDNFGGGVGRFEEMRAKFPSLAIHRGFLHEDTTLPARHFDAIVSCSVVEHIPAPAIDGTVRRIHELLRPGGLSAHAMDLTVAGIMRNHGLLGSFTAAHGLDDDLEDLGRAAQEDLDAFYLSPQGHHRWRKFLGKTYDEYPYRRVTSLNLVAAKDA